MLLLTLLFVVQLCHPCLTAGGWRWDKYRQDFISITSIPTYAQIYQETQIKIREKSHRKLHGQVIRVGYYDLKHMIEFINNGTKITGAFGEIWNVLSEYLNFTIQPVVLKDRLYSVRFNNGTRSGIIPILNKGKQIDVIPRMSCDHDSSSLVDCTMPILKTSVRLYVRPIIRSDDLWIFKMFQLSTVFAIMVVLFIIIIFGCIATKFYNQMNTKKINLILSDRIFYTFNTFFAQGWEPLELVQTSKILVISNRLFCWFLMYVIANGILILLTRTELMLPFTNLESLFENSKYQLFQFNGSLAVTQFPMKYVERVTTFKSRKGMFESICSSNRKYAAIELQDSKEYTNVRCTLLPTDESVKTLWITSGTVQGFPYMQSINMGILKMHESGLIKALENRFKVLLPVENVLNGEAIDFNHVYIVLAILLSGIFIAIILFVCEHIVFWHQRNQKSKVKQVNNQKRDR